MGRQVEPEASGVLDTREGGAVMEPRRRLRREVIDMAGTALAAEAAILERLYRHSDSRVVGVDSSRPPRRQRRRELEESQTAFRDVMATYERAATEAALGTIGAERERRLADTREVVATLQAAANGMENRLEIERIREELEAAYAAYRRAVDYPSVIFFCGS